MKSLFLAFVVALFSSVALGQTLTVIGEEPLDLSPLARGERVALGLSNTGETPLKFSLRLRDSGSNAFIGDDDITLKPLNDIELSRGSQVYVDLAPLADLEELPRSGYLVINALSNGTRFTVETRFLNPIPFQLHWIILLAPVIAVIVVLVAAAHGSTVPRPSTNIISGWLAGTPKVSFTESFGSLTTGLIALSNFALIPELSEAVTAELDPLQVAGLVFALPILLGPIIVKVSSQPVGPKEKLCCLPISEGENDKASADDKVRGGWYNLAAIISLTGTLLQIYILFAWLQRLDISFLPSLTVGTLAIGSASAAPAGNPLIGWDIIIATSIFISVSVLCYRTVVRAFRTLRLCTKTVSKDNTQLTYALIPVTVSADGALMINQGGTTTATMLLSRSAPLPLSNRKLYNTLY